MGILVSCSGGMDSSTLLAMAQEADPNTEAVIFQYGSKHGRWEVSAAREVCHYLQVPYEILDFSGIAQHFKSHLLAAGGPIPEGHYQAESMSQTVVPARNIIFISVLAGLAWSRGIDSIWLGIHSGDHAIYPDCRPEFFLSMKDAIRTGTDGHVTIEAPLLHMNKRDILGIGEPLGVPYHLTRTCYKDQPVACGRCGSCQERLEAFALHGVRDPLEYESRDLL